MTARLVLAVGAHAGVAERARWARTPVRVVESPAPGWVWVLPDAPTTALDRAAEETSEHGDALLLSVGEWRSELQVWRREHRVLALGWEPGGASGLEREAAVAAAEVLAAVVSGVDVRALALLLSGPRSGTGAWRDLVEHLRLPLPPGFPDTPADELLPGLGERVSTTGLLEAAGVDDDVRWVRGFLRWFSWALLATAAAMSLVAAGAKGSPVDLAVGLACLAALAWWVVRYRARRTATDHPHDERTEVHP